MGRILAAVDIGSNTVHLLVADADSVGVRRLSELNEWLSLGEIVARTGQIGVQVQDRVIRTLAEYKRHCKAEGAEGWYVFGTEALRKAKNSKVVLKRLRAELGIDLDLISGEREAELGVRGTLIDSDAAESMLMVEVGGGSAQVARVVEGKLISDHSLPIGTGALTGKVDLTAPCDQAHFEALERMVREAILTVPDRTPPDLMVASGGVGRGLWRALHPDGDRVLHRAELDYLVWATQRLDTDQIIARFRVKPKRAATLLPGAVVFRGVMESFNMEEMLVSRFGVREGAILEMFDGGIPICPL